MADSYAEYKQVTVLFADVVHSMDIAAAVGAERLREMMTDLFNRSSKVVQRYGGTVDKFTGDGIMAVFGAPIALEDHAVRACRAALDIHKDLKHLATALETSDGITLQLRIGLNSGEVIAGEIGSGPLAYTAIGEQVGMAQRMESAATPGAVMVSESTARLVENAAILGEAEWVHIKGADDPVPARRLLAVATGRGPRRVETSFVGREWEMGALDGILGRSINGSGSVVVVAGPSGIGKSRLVRELSSHAEESGVEVFVTYCESHTTDVPFHAAAGLLRAVAGTHGLEGEAARAAVRARLAGADAEDLVLLDDLLGIGDPAAVLPQVDPDARRRRLVAMVNTAALMRRTPVVYVIEDAHWIDEISETMIAEFLTVIPQTPSLVLVTHRPEYSGALAHTPRSQTIALEPLDDSQIASLSDELLGANSSVAGLADMIAKRAAGNPFFAEEIVRDLSERDVLLGGRGCYLCTDPVADVSVPSTLQAAIAARIDRLEPAAKRTLNAAAVIGTRFSPQMLGALEIDPALDSLIRAELVDQIAFAPKAEYAFRHPLVRTVAYESQLRSDRAHLHRRLADSIQHDDQNAALIAEHLESAGDLDGAYEWHMRAGAWSIKLDITAARTSWLRARAVADGLPADHPERLAMRIAPRTLLCTTTYRADTELTDTGFDELRMLCTEAGDKRSLAMATLGHMNDRMAQAYVLEASQLASESMALLESIGDPELTLGMSYAMPPVKQETGEMAEILRWSQMAIDLANGDPVKGNLLIESPLTIAVVWRGVARSWLGIPGWREDFDLAVELARNNDPIGLAAVQSYKYALSVGSGVLLADDTALRDLDEGLEIASGSNNNVLGLAKYVMAVVLFESGTDSARGLQMAAEVRDMCRRGRFFKSELPVLDVYCAWEHARRGDIDNGIQLAREAVDTELSLGQVAYAVRGTGKLVDMLLERGGGDDVQEAADAIDRLAAIPADDLVVRDITLLRLRALLANACGDQTAYRDFRDRYRTMANDLGFEGHMAWAEAMP
jgi:adenylate cyclase